MRCNRKKVEAKSSMFGDKYYNHCKNCGLKIDITQETYFEFTCGITPDWTKEDYEKCVKSDKLVEESKMTYRTVESNKK